jgi:hypothetical protein
MNTTKKILLNLLNADLARIENGLTREDSGYYSVQSDALARLEQLGCSYKADDFADEECIQDAIAQL